MTDLSQQLAEMLREVKQQGLLRSLTPVSREGGPRITVSNKSYLNLSGNDYLGICSNRQLLEEFYQGLKSERLLDHFAPGASASRLMTGNTLLYNQLENLLADMYGTRRALVFNSGYHGNLGILPALAKKKDLILADKLCHASLIDGIRLSRADCIRFPHLDYDRLHSLLAEKRTSYDRVFLVTESIFSMDGDAADLSRLAALKHDFDCQLYLDEAHAVGVFGNKGLGLAEQEGLTGEIDLLFGTFGKALGGLGGFVVCADELADYLVNRSRPFIYTTGLPPVCLNWLLFILEKLPSMQDRRTRLLEQASFFRHKLGDMGLTTGGCSQIIPVILGEALSALTASEQLRDEGFWVTAIRPPTVPAGSARLRLSLTTDMRVDELQKLAESILKAVR